MKYCIIGGRKCGTTSLQKYLKSKGVEVERREQLFTKYDGFNIYSQEFSEYQPILILREPVDRCFSDWKYAVKTHRTKLKYRDYCIESNYNPGLGELNPLSQSNYKKWLEPWKNIIGFRFEDLIKIPEFPKENQTDGEISNEDRDGH